MKKLRIFLALLAGIALLAAFCGGSALAEEKNTPVHFYNGGNDADSLELNFSFGLDLLLRDLETKGYVKAKILYNGEDYADAGFPVEEGCASVNLSDAMFRLKTALDEAAVDPAAVQPELELYACNNADSEGSLCWKGTLVHNADVQYPCYAFSFVHFTQANPENPREIWGVDLDDLFFNCNGAYKYQVQLNYEDLPEKNLKLFRTDYLIKFDEPLKHGDVITLYITDADGAHINAVSYNVARKMDDAEPAPAATDAAPATEVPMTNTAEPSAVPETTPEVTPEATQAITVVSATPSAAPATPEADPVEAAPADMEIPVDTVLEEPTEEPSEEPSVEPSEEPSEEPSVEPTEEAAEEPTEEPSAEPTEEPTEEPTPEPAEEAVPEAPAMPEFRLYLKLGDREYDFLSKEEPVQTVIMGAKDELRVVCEIDPEADAKGLQWQIDVVREGEDKAESSVKPKGAFDEKGKLKKENTPYIITASYNWNNRAGTYHVRILKDAMGVRFALADAPDQWLEDGDTIAAQDADALLVCALEGVELKASIADEEVQLVPAEAAEDAAYAAWKVDGTLPAEGELTLNIVDDRGNESGITLQLDPAPAIALNPEDITPAVGSLAGNTEPDAALCLLSGEETIAEGKANERGDFNLPLPEDKQLGDAFILQVTDGAGNLVEKEIVIAAEKKDPLTLEKKESYAITTQTLAEGIVINGFGDPDVRRLDCYVDDVRQDNYVVMIDPDGRWSLAVDAGRLGGVEGKHILRIEDANDPEYRLEINIALDTVCNLAMDPAYAGAAELTGTADGYAKVEVVLDGVSVSAKADDTGKFVLKLPRELQLDEKLQVTAADYRMNAAAPVEITVVEQTVVKIAMQAAQAGSLVKFSGTAEPGYALAVYQDAQVGFAVANADGSFECAVPVESLKDGAAVARYADARFEKYAGDPVEITLDTEVPVLKLDQQDLDAADTFISGSCSEAAKLTITAGGKLLAAADVAAGEAFEIAFEAQPEGTLMTISAADGAGNASETMEFTVAPKQQLMIMLDAPAPGAQCSYMDEMQVSGYVLSRGAAPAITLQTDAGSFEIETEAMKDMPEDAAKTCGAWIDADTCARFQLTLDVSDLPLGEKTLCFLNGEDAVEILPAGDETRPALMRSYEIIKPAGYLPLRICMLAVLLIGIVVCAVVLGKTGRKLKILKDAELDSNSNISKLTITRRR